MTMFKVRRRVNTHDDFKSERGGEESWLMVILFMDNQIFIIKNLMKLFVKAEMTKVGLFWEHCKKTLNATVIFP
jgi:hypothetical protein